MVFYSHNGNRHYEDRLIHFLRREEYLPVLRLIENVSVHQLLDCYDTTVLHLAAKYNNVMIIRYLIRRGCRINVVNKCGMTPLIMGIMSQSVDAVRVLINANANIYSNYFFGKSALQVAIGLPKTPRSISILRLFFKKITSSGSDAIELAEKLGNVNCPLYRVIYLDNAAVTKIMIDLQYSGINCQDPDTGNTALHEAASQRDSRNVLVLLEKGADISLKNRKGLSASVHRFSNNLEIMRLLLKTNIVWTEPDDSDNDIMKLGAVLEKGTKDTVQLFLENHEIDFKIKDNFERTPLHYLARNRNPDVLKLFENSEFYINALDKGNYTALHYAAARGDPNMVRFLLERGANANIQGYHGYSPLFYAVSQITLKSQRKKKCIELLMLYGADPEYQKDGQTVIGIAQEIRMPLLIEPVLAYLALVESQKKQISEQNRSCIASDSETKSYYESCLMDIERTKEDTIYGSLTTYTALTLNEYALSRYVQIPEVSNRFTRGDFDYNYYYDHILRKRFNQAVEILRLKKIAIEIVSDAIVAFNANYIIMDAIVSFLNHEDLKRLEENSIL